MATGAPEPEPSGTPDPCPGPRPAPLADRRRPARLDDVVGQEHLTGPGGPLRRGYETGAIPSMILWGPPGTGKTTLARILGTHPGHRFEQFSAVLSGVKEVRATVERAREMLASEGRRTILFVDEIHRFNRAQQDAFLPHVESGLITLIGATTENPSFEVNHALLSRCRVYVLRPLDDAALRGIGETALAALPAGPRGERGEIDEAAWEMLLRLADGDARKLLNLLEAAWAQRAPGSAAIGVELLERVAQQPVPVRQGDEDHFDWISALHKSLRGSDPHASLYWLARMLEAGEDPLFVVRRLVVFASEDVGLADPGALVYAIAARDAVEFVGMPEGYLALSQLVLYLALAPKSNSAYAAYHAAAGLVREKGALPVPLRIRNAPTGLTRGLGYGKGYRYPHDEPGRWVAESYLPDAIGDRVIYRPSAAGREARLVEEHRQRTRGFYRLRTGDRPLPPTPAPPTSPPASPPERPEAAGGGGTSSPAA